MLNTYSEKEQEKIFTKTKKNESKKLRNEGKNFEEGKKENVTTASKY